MLSANPFPRPIANFKPSSWGNRFLHYTPDNKEIEAQQELAKALKEEVNKELLSARNKPLKDQLCLIDSIERLSVAYQFEKEIHDALQRIHDMSTLDQYSDDIFLTSLCFRLLRQHGFQVSCDVFKGFMSMKGKPNEVQGILSLYEACHVRIHGENVLDEALVLTTSKLKNLIEDGELSSHARVLQEQIHHALGKALHRRLTHVESLHYMQVYEQDPTHNKALLRFAKVDFNLLQSSYKKELSDLSRWWIRIGLTEKLPLRDRVVECHFWSMGVYHEPEYSMGRKMTAIGAQILTALDDLYDAYGTLEELQIFTKVVQRWDKSYLAQLPEVYTWFYETLIMDVLEKMESHLAPKGRSQYVKYAREEVKALCQAYLAEVSWRRRNYIPTFDEYMEIMVRDTGMVAQTVFVFLDMDSADHEAFEWLCSIPKPFKSLALMMRILNDIGSSKVERTRGHSSLIIEAYKRQYGVSHEQARKELLDKTHDLWKDITEAMIQPTQVPMPLLKCILNLARDIEYVYKGGEDAFTLVNKAMIEDITSCCVTPIPI